MHQVDIVGAQVFVYGVDARAPQGVGVGPQHALGPRGGARGVLHAARGQRVRCAARRDWRVQRVEVVGVWGAVRGGIAVVVGGHREPAQTFATLCHQFGKLGLGDAGHGGAVLGVIGQLVAHGAGIGGDGDCADPGASVPGQQGLRAVVQMDQHPLTGSDAALRQAARNAAHALVKLAVGPGLVRAVEGRPDHEGMIAPGLGAGFQQPGDVKPDKGVLVGGGKNAGHGPIPPWRR